MKGKPLFRCFKRKDSVNGIALGFVGLAGITVASSFGLRSGLTAVRCAAFHPSQHAVWGPRLCDGAERAQPEGVAYLKAVRALARMDPTHVFGMNGAPNSLAHLCGLA